MANENKTQESQEALWIREFVQYGLENVKPALKETGSLPQRAFTYAKKGERAYGPSAGFKTAQAQFDAWAVENGSAARFTNVVKEGFICAEAGLTGLQYRQSSSLFIGPSKWRKEGMYLAVVEDCLIDCDSLCEAIRACGKDTKKLSALRREAKPAKPKEMSAAQKQYNTIMREEEERILAEAEEAALVSAIDAPKPEGFIEGEPKPAKPAKKAKASA